MAGQYIGNEKYTHNPRGFAYVFFRNSYRYAYWKWSWFRACMDAQGIGLDDWVFEGIDMWDRMVVNIDETDPEAVYALVEKIQDIRVKAESAGRSAFYNSYRNEPKHPVFLELDPFRDGPVFDNGALEFESLDTVDSVLNMLDFPEKDKAAFRRFATGEARSLREAFGTKSAWMVAYNRIKKMEQSSDSYKLALAKQALQV